jgi:hypothetical protein
MPEFTPEWIAKIRLSSHLIEPPAAEVIGELLDEIQRLQSRIAELEAEQRWIPVSERLPEEDDYYYVAFSLSNMKNLTDIYYFKSDSKFKWFKDLFCRDIALFFDTVTHWKKQSQPPKMEDNKES